MAYSNSSSAYDLSAYEYAPKREQKAQVPLRVVKSSKRATLASLLSPKVFSSFAVVITLISLIVYNQARLTEITGEIYQIEKQLRTLESEYVIIENQLASTMHPPTIAEQAQQELGMQKLEKYQTEYVYLFEEDKIEVSEGAEKNSVMQKAKIALNNAVNALKEYISGE